MAINITSSPATNVSAHNPIEWKFQFTALGTPPQVKKMIYYLADGSNNQISEIYIWTPKDTNEIQTFDASHIARGLVSTIFPSASGAQMTDTECVKQIKVRYAEVTFDTTTCEETVGAYSNSSTVNVWNVALNNDTAAILDFSGSRTGFLMNSYPSKMTWSPDAEPYIWFGGVGSIRLTWYSNTGASMANTTINFTTATTAKYLCIDWRFYSITTKPSSLKLEVNEGFGYVTKWIDLSLCSCRDFYTGLNFLDSRGGRSSVSLLCNGFEVSTQRSIAETYRYNPIQNERGRSVMNPDTKEQIKVQTILANTYEGQIYGRSLFASPGHHIMRMDSTGNKTWQKFIVTGGTTKILEGSKEILVEITGYLADNKNSQFSDL